MEHEVILTNKQWLPKQRGWKFPYLKEAGTKLKEIYVGDNQNCSFIEYDDRYYVLRYLGKLPTPSEVHVIITRESIGDRRMTKMYKRYLLAGAFTIPLLTLLLGFKQEIASAINGTPKSYERSIVTPQPPIALQPFAGNSFDRSETVWINNMLVTSKNGTFDRYNDGTPIVHATCREDWDSCNRRGIGCWCYYNNDEKLGRTYGKLYNWYAVFDKKHGGLIPSGWQLIGIDNIGNLPRPSSLLRSVQGWRNDFPSKFGTDRYGFDAKPGGYVTPDFKFVGRDSTSTWWTPNPHEPSYPDYKLYYNWHIQYNNDSVFWDEVPAQYGYYIRCIKKQ